MKPDAPPSAALGILETTGFSPALVALDAMEKAAGVEIFQAELNDMLGVCLKIVGTPATVAAALQAGHAAAEAMGGRPVHTILNHVDATAWKAIRSAVEFNPLIQQNVVIEPAAESASDAARESAARTPSPRTKDTRVAESTSFALGLIETQGFTAVFEAIDSACKAANVEVIGKEKLGGGYVTVIVRGDVAAVKTAVDVGKSKVEGLGKLIAAHVIARPSPAVLSLLPKS